MGKLLFLSEINCNKFLRSKGIYPDEFYTDFLMFKNRSFSFNDVDIVILFAGSCAFSKRHVFDMIKILQQRIDNPDDTGIRSLTVLTDAFLPKVNKYYKFQGKLSNISEYNGWKLVEKHSNIWDELPRGITESEQVFYLTAKDKGDISKLRQAYSELRSSDEELRSLIKIPNFSGISEI